LEEAGKMAGVTRERIRQIQERLLGLLPKHPVVMPALDRALALLASRSPIEPAAGADLMGDVLWPADVEQMGKVTKEQA
jgi:hypothetical protein